MSSVVEFTIYVFNPNLSVDVFPLVTAADTFLQSLDTGLNVAGKDTIKINLLAATTDYLITQLCIHIHADSRINV